MGHTTSRCAISRWDWVIRIEPICVIFASLSSEQPDCSESGLSQSAGG